MNRNVKISLPLREPDGSTVLHTLQGEWLVGAGGFSDDDRQIPKLSLTAEYQEQARWGSGYWFVIRSASGKLVVYQQPKEGTDAPSVAIYDSFEAMEPNVPTRIYDFALKKAGLKPPQQFREVPLAGVREGQDEMNEDTKPDNFDWVAAYSECSVANVFKRLSEIVEKNVDSVKALAAEKFEFSPEEGRFVVIRRTHQGSPSVAFLLSAGEIKVMYRPKNFDFDYRPMFTAKPRFTDTRDCILEVDGKPLRLWQVSQLALDRLFFEG